MARAVAQVWPLSGQHEGVYRPVGGNVVGPPSHCEVHSAHHPGSPCCAGVGGTASCMRTSRGEATFFSAVVDWQRQLAGGHFPFPNVQHVDVFQEAVVFGVGDVSADYGERPGGGV